MSARPGEAGRAAARELAAEANERAVHLVDVEAVRAALLGTPVALTELERGAVVALCDLGGFDVAITAAGLGVSVKRLGDRMRVRRRRVPALTRDLWAAVMLRPAADLVDAVASRDAEAVASALCGLNRQHLAALAVVLAAAVRDSSLISGVPIPDHASL